MRCVSDAEPRENADLEVHIASLERRLLAAEAEVPKCFVQIICSIFAKIDSDVFKGN